MAHIHIQSKTITEDKSNQIQKVLRSSTYLDGKLFYDRKIPKSYANLSRNPTSPRQGVISTKAVDPQRGIQIQGRVFTFTISRIGVR